MIKKDLDLRSLFVKNEQKSPEELAAAERELDLTGDLARKCLTHEDFNLYKKSYVKTEASLIDSMMIYTKNFVESDHGDVMKYALTMVRLFTKLQHLRYLIKNVEEDSKKGKKANA